ncbi:MAG: replicative DNA helicase [Elusimicrobia bacterium]|nr:MAG: replicative DNA helicase [Elusimicrobiota bacterium]
MADNIKVPPQALDAERAVLGSMLIEPEAVERAVEILNEKSFYKDSHRRIFDAAITMQDRGEPVDLVTMAEELKTRKVLGDVGGSSYLKELTHSVSTAAHVEYYAKLVHDKAILRELINLSTTIVEDCHGEKEPSALLDQAQGAIFKLTQQQQTKGFTSAKELAHSVIEDIEKLQKNKGSVTGVGTGLTDLDKKTAGFQKGDMIVIGARPSQGKTALALNIAANVVLDKDNPRPVAIFSMEMSKQAIMTRFIASEAKVNLHEVRNGFFRRDRWTDLTNAAARLSEAPLYIEDTPGLSVLEVRSQARRLSNELNSKGQQLSLILLDYLQLMRGSSRRSENRQQEVSEISRGLKGLARDLDVPIVVLSQLSRRVEDKGRPDARPQLSDLRESGAIEQDADVVAFIYREGYYKRDDPTVQTKAEIIIAKQRNGPTGVVELMFRAELARFENLEVMPEGEMDEEEAQVTFG